MTVSSLLLTCTVGIAGAFGALTRYILGRFIAERAGSCFPLGTLLINVSGAFVIGLLFALAWHKRITVATQAVLATGFLGGYTTFSTMNWEGVQLARAGGTRPGLVYLCGSFLLGLVAAACGLALGGWL